jgi:hypothetical protein
MSQHMTTPQLIRALGGADAICNPGCACRGTYTGPERRKEHRCVMCGGSGILRSSDIGQACYCQQDVLP